MKFVRSISAIAIIFIAIIAGRSTATAVEAYKTKKDQVVVTGLKAQQQYDVQYKNARGKDGQRRVKANNCGEALIGKAAKFQSLMIDTQSIDPQILTLKEHRKCSIRRATRNNRTITTIQPTAFPTNPATASPK
jgi:hypothetical protein